MASAGFSLRQEPAQLDDRFELVLGVVAAATAVTKLCMRDLPFASCVRCHTRVGYEDWQTQRIAVEVSVTLQTVDI